jgi:hypothetical protein
MSAANSAAKKRITPSSSYETSLQQSQSQSQSQSQPQPQPIATGLTLQQVISVIDRRLTSLEESSKINDLTVPLPVPESEVPLINLDEIDIRFNILAEEISNLKQIIMELQSYTMSVNKMLLEERLQENLLNVKNTDVSGDLVDIENSNE